MHLFYFLIAILGTIQVTNADRSIALWNSYKRIYKKQYINAREEQHR